MDAKPNPNDPSSPYEATPRAESILRAREALRLKREQQSQARLEKASKPLPVPDVKKPQEVDTSNEKPQETDVSNKNSKKRAREQPEYWWMNLPKPIFPVLEIPESRDLKRPKNDPQPETPPQESVAKESNVPKVIVEVKPVPPESTNPSDLSFSTVLANTAKALIPIIPVIILASIGNQQRRARYTNHQLYQQAEYENDSTWNMSGALQ